MHRFLILFCFFILYGAAAQDVHHWESLVLAWNEWHYFRGISEPPASWTDLSFDDSGWQKGAGGIGWGDNDDATVISRAPSVYMRRKFTVDDPSKILSLILYVDFDDGFVAYLNGKEIARANIGSPGVRPAYNQYALNCDFEAQLPKGGQPARFVLGSVQRSNLQPGENVLSIQVHDCNATSSDLSSTTFLIAGISEAGSFYQALPSWFQPPETYGSHLPVIAIETGGYQIPNEPKIDAWMKIVDNGGGKINSPDDPGTDYDGKIGIEIRGQSSQMFPKKSYGFETRTESGSENKVSLLGMPAHDDWVLYAPYSDKTMLRNDITYYLGRQLGNWQPRTRFVEVYLNGAYIGVYQLIERIKRGKDRVDIPKIESTDTSGDRLTGGYIFRVDKLDGLSYNDYFNSVPTYRYYDARNYSFSYYYPKADAIVVSQKEYLRSFIMQFENNLNAPWFKDYPNHYSKFIDVDSFIDFQIINELSNNIDGYRYSTYFYKKRDSDGGKMYAGPIWDFDLGYGNLDYSWRHQSTSQWCYTNYGPGEPNCMHWWARLMEDSEYVKKVKTRWSQLRKASLHTDSVMARIDAQVELLGPAIERNFKKWPIIGTYVWPNSYIGPTYSAEVSFLKRWIRDRLTWMDTKWYISTEIEEENGLAELMIYPNPAKDFIRINWQNNLSENSRIELFDYRGVCLLSTVINGGSEATADLNISHLSNGIYLLRLTDGQFQKTTKIIKH